MKPPLYKIQHETQDGVTGYRICLDFQNQLLPLPKHWYKSEEVAILRVLLMQREDLALIQEDFARIQQESKR